METQQWMKVIIGILVNAYCRILVARAELEDEAATNDTKATNLLQQIELSAENKVRPNVYGPPVDVKVDFFVQSLGPINEVDMDFSIEIYFRQQWIDRRVSFKSQETEVHLPVSYMNHLWLPDLYFPNEKEGKWHEITVPNKDITIYPNGTIRYSARLTLRLACNMLLMHFPLDYQKCRLKISSYSYDTSQLRLMWADSNPVDMIRDELHLPQFELLNVSHSTCNISYKSGDFTCLQATFHLKRQIGFYVLQTYMPSILIVTLSWVSFWINKDAVPARISLGVTTVLTMTTQLSTSRSNSMRVSYPKAIDVWYASCMVFVFGALLEYAMVNVLSRSSSFQPHQATIGKCGGPPRKNKSGDKLNSETRLTSNDIEMQCPQPPDYESMATGAHEEEDEEVTGHSVNDYYKRAKYFCRSITAKGVDHASRTIFPGAFGVFNLIYWIVYTQPVERDDH